MTKAPRTHDRARDPARPLDGAHVVVGVGGGIAAYKAALLVRLLDKAGAHVEVAMTARAQEFVGATTFQALTRRPVFTDVWEPSATIAHIELADRADLMIVAPATANLIARMAAGYADDAVTATALATTAPVLLAPSMNVNMWQNPLTQANVRRLIEVAKMHTVGPGDGFLACAWVGPGRLAEPETIVEAAAAVLAPQDLAGRHVVVTAGPTYEAIDPARFVGNRSSGKMGVAIAAAAVRRGARVTLILGPSAVAPPLGAEVVRVESARELAAAVAAVEGACDAIVMAAAVADYRPKAVATQKLKRGAIGKTMTLELVANDDVLAGLGARRAARKGAKGRRPLLVGFAAETEDVIANARKKLATKRCDLVVANDVSEADAGFAVDTNRVVLVDAASAIAVPHGPKTEVAHRIVDRIVALL